MRADALERGPRRPRPPGAGRRPGRERQHGRLRPPAGDRRARSGRTAAGCTSTARSGCGPHADPSRRHLVEGVGDADSWTTDAHKWLNVPYDCGLALTAHPAAHQAAMTLGRRVLRRDRGPGARQLQLGAGVLAACPRVHRLGGAPVARPIGRRGADLPDERPRAAVRGGPRRRRTAPGCSTTWCSTRCWCGSRTRRATRRWATRGPTRSSPRSRRAASLWLGGTTWHDRRAMRISVSGWSTTTADVDRSLEVIRRGSSGRIRPPAPGGRQPAGALWSNQPT